MTFLSNNKIQLKSSNSPVLLSSSHAFLIDRAVQLSQTGEDDLIVHDDGFNDLINMSLAGHRVLTVRDGHQSGSKTDGKVIWVHHVLITVLGQTRKMKRQREREKKKLFT